MNFDVFSLQNLRRDNPTWRILCADRAPLILTFLDQAFVSRGIISATESQLMEVLGGIIFRQTDTPPKPAGRGRGRKKTSAQDDVRALLREWANPRMQILRRFARKDTDEFLYDITPAAQKAVSFVSSLQGYRFVGTESRLLSVIDLLKQLTLQEDAQTADDYIRELEKQREELDEKIMRLKSGQSSVLSDTQYFDRFEQFEQNARTLSSDLREVEYNLRDLYRNIRVQIETYEGSKADLLEQFFSKSDVIADSEQGTTAKAFERLLFDLSTREQLVSMLKQLYQSPRLEGFSYDARLKYVYRDWLNNAKQINAVIADLDKEMRAYLDSKLYLENRSILMTLKRITKKTVEMPQLLNDKETEFMSFELPEAEVNLPFERPLYKESVPVVLNDQNITEGTGSDSDAEDLFNQELIDHKALYANLAALTASEGAVSLKRVTEVYPLEHGAAELLAYIVVAEEEFNAHWYEREFEDIPCTITLPDGTQGENVIHLEKLIIS